MGPLSPIDRCAGATVCPCDSSYCVSCDVHAAAANQLRPSVMKLATRLWVGFQKKTFLRRRAKDGARSAVLRNRVREPVGLPARGVVITLRWSIPQTQAGFWLPAHQRFSSHCHVMFPLGRHTDTLNTWWCRRFGVFVACRKLLKASWKTKKE